MKDKWSKRTYIFNPENDLALAYGGENYTPPPMAMQLRYDLQMLPIWYAEDTNNIYAPNVNNAEWIQNIRNIFGRNINLINDKELQKCIGGFAPWGWSADARKRLIDKGVDRSYLPKPMQIEKLRDLSHRRISIEIMKELKSRLDFEITPIPREMDNLEEIIEWALTYPKCFIKAPWSSSGKGIFRVLEVEAIDFKRWCNGIFNKQKSIVGEVPLDVIIDFAMEFECVDSKCEFRGYSVFKNDKHCSFDSGLVASKDMLKEKLIRKGAKEKELDEIRIQIEHILTKMIAPYYSGYLGVDMLICCYKGEIKIDPCVELNLRMTMGALTSIIGEKYLSEGSCGEFKIEYHKRPFDMKKYIDELICNDPPYYENGKIKYGCQVLTPIYEDMRYCCYINVKTNEEASTFLESF